MSHSGQLAADETTHAAAVAATPALVRAYGTMLFANLPDPTKTPKGTRTSISDCGLTFASANYGATATGAGANFVPLICNGVNWKIG